MKIAYVINHDLTKPSGVTKKVMMQVNYWESKGHTVSIFCTNSSSNTVSTDKLKFYNNFGRILLNKNILDDLKLFNPDLVYYRYSIFGRTLYKIVNTYKCIGEANTFEVREFWVLLKKYKKVKYLVLWLTNKFLRPLIIAKSKGLVTVTHEMARYPGNSQFNKNICAIPNGINMPEYAPLKQKENTKSESIQLFFMGSPDQPWHGVDIIESLASKLPDFTFHVVGVEGNDSDNIYFHGYLSSDKYNELLKTSHICIGSLALFRNGMDEGSALKIREYVALGFPVIVGHYDASIIDSQNEYPWFKRIDFKCDGEDEILNEIKSFCIKFRSYVLPKEDKFYFSVEHTEEKRLDFFTFITQNK